MSDRETLAMAEAIQVELELDDRMNNKVRDFNMMEEIMVHRARQWWAFSGDLSVLSGR